MEDKKVHGTETAGQDEHEHEHRKLEFVYMCRENTLYNLTPFNQKRLDIEVVGLKTSDLLAIHDVIEKLPAHLSVKQFLGLDRFKTLLSTQFANKLITRGSNSDSSISIKSRNSFQTLEHKAYLELVVKLKADYFVSLSEEKTVDPHAPAGKKSDKRSLKKTLAFLQETLDFLREKKITEQVVLAPFLDTEFDIVRQDMIAALREKAGSIGGIMVYGTGDAVEGGPSFEHRTKVLRELRPLVESEFMRKKVIGNCSDGNFVDVLLKVNEGFNFFEASYPFDLAEKGHAINFVPEEWLKQYEKYDGHSEHMEEGRLRQDVDLFTRRVPTLDLNLAEFMQHKDSIFPLLESYPLKGYSKAYICHLLNNQEMTGNVLLTIHNCFVYQEFFRVLNRREFRANKFGLIYSFCKFVCK
jgi:tRNA-guanine family transglycosylase